MRRQIIVMFCGLFLLPLPAAFAEVPPVAQNRGALFRVQDAGHTLYLFGTIHVGAPDFYPLEPTVTQALEGAGRWRWRSIPAPTRAPPWAPC